MLESSLISRSAIRRTDNILVSVSKKYCGYNVIKIYCTEDRFPCDQESKCIKTNPTCSNCMLRSASTRQCSSIISSPYTREYKQIDTQSHVPICFVRVQDNSDSAYINTNVHVYLWLVSFPRMRSPDGSMGEGSRLRQEARDWLESSLDTVHTPKHIWSIH